VKIKATLMKTADKFTALRTKMTQIGADFYLVPSSDAHNSEYLPAAWERREWMSGFTGSAGEFMLGHDKGHVWTDGRYELQAAVELDANLTETHIVAQRRFAPVDWLLEHGHRKVAALDPKTISIRNAHELQSAMTSIDGKCVPFVTNLVDQVWQDQPELEHRDVTLFPDKYAGLSTTQKLSRIRAALKAKKADVLVLSMLDEIAWTFNIRGTDMDFNPFVISYAVITATHATLFLDPSQHSDELGRYAKRMGFELATYDSVANVLSTLTGTVMLDDGSASWWVERQLNQAKIQFSPSPVLILKAVKNSVEQSGMQQAHRWDAVILIKHAMWLEQDFKNTNEMALVHKLEDFRRENEAYRGQSFRTISGYGPNGAIIHRSVTPETSTPLGDDNLLLIDAGGQYVCGTTDVTRVWHFGKPSGEQKRHYTVVLKAHLALGRAVFPAGTSGRQLDTLARNELWQHGLTYNHGTGHGVGCHLGVHEGPQNISSGYSDVPLEPGMILSNEPGVYVEGKHGIRIENLMTVVALDLKSDTTDKPFYGFEDLTLMPYNAKLIDMSLLTETEVAQVNAYHARVRKVISPELNADEKAWLQKMTQTL
jgi:Xaa-Pro aminopeptidase